MATVVGWPLLSVETIVVVRGVQLGEGAMVVSCTVQYSVETTSPLVINE